MGGPSVRIVDPLKKKKKTEEEKSKKGFFPLERKKRDGRISCVLAKSEKEKRELPQEGKKVLLR